ncbi:Cysteine-rich receptor protein [Heracleum sosnowskyi]|uniref:Cysteine-rich receptor protein n=1 Tax=Heracleum sosnowskyi TaxID=360622 RepID=A0AAD8HNF5_9APIA|nr:Cysteine-rich receptor protein [Heracleum sosnowskyi]
MKQWWKTVVVVVVLAVTSVTSDPQANLVSQECSEYDTFNTFEFFSNLNATLAQLRRQLSVGKAHFATAKLARTTNPVYSMVQCRNYLSTADCVACFDVAALDIRKFCNLANGGHVIYDGCFLRYELHRFDSEIEFGSSFEVCGENKSVSTEAAFNLVTVQLLKDLAAATPKIKSYFAVAKRQVFDRGPSEKASVKVYALAQCVDTISQSGCKSCLTKACTGIQTCLPQLGGSFVAAGCFLRYSVTSFFADNDITNIMPGVQEGSSSMKTAIVAGIVGVLSLLLLVLALLLWYRSLQKRKAGKRADILGVTKFQGPTIYNYKDLKSATKNFSEEYKVGEGGFADVYKGITENGIVVAVKKLTVITSREKIDIESEVRLVSNVHHRNIIRLLGFSGKGPVKLLVYEYMENGSLDTFLYGDRRGTLSWKQRIDIIHGTWGYTAPEYAIHGHLSEKVDTYGFGIVVLEILSGQSCIRMKNELLIESLLAYVWKSYDNGTYIKLIDETIDPSEYNVKDAKKIIEIALKCTQSPFSLRPTMSEVVALLANDASPEQKQPNKGPVE